MESASKRKVTFLMIRGSKGAALAAALATLIVLNAMVSALPLNLLDFFGTDTINRNNLISYAPEVWLSLLALVFGTLIIVISIASESTPKLIDLFVGDYKSRLFIWLISLSGLENIILQLIHTQQTVFFDNLIFLNNYVLLPAFVILSIPYIFYILKYTKSSNVIDKIFDENRKTIRRVRKIRDSEIQISENQHNLFETINQLHDILQYVRFKEPKADIIHKFGKSLRFYLTRKKSFPHGYFGLGGEIRKDISFRTLAAKFPQVEAEQTFYEQKVLRIIGTSYLLLMQDGHFDLASMCGSELLETGKTAAELSDKHAVSAVILHFNTLLRYGINHGLKTKEIRNVHNTIFHYSQLIDFLIKRNEVERIVECCNYFAFYGKEVRRLTHSEASFIFLIDAFATELKKILITLHDNRFDRELQLMVLKIFNELNSHQENGTADHRLANNGSRLIQISLCLYYIYKMEEEFNEIIIQTMISDFSGMDEYAARRVIMQDCDRIKEEREEFWEDTDQGNSNIFYTPHKNELSKFSSYFLFKLQNSTL